MQSYTHKNMTYGETTKNNNTRFSVALRMVVYKRRHYYVPVPTEMPSARKPMSDPSLALYRKRFAYTELKDMNND
jgi:hypothetical protein